MNRSSFLGLDLMVDVGLSYVESFASNLSDQVQETLKKAFSDFLHNRITYEQCQQVLIQIIGRDDALVQLNDILTLPDDPLVYHEQDSETPSSLPVYTSKHFSSSRKKTRTWTTIEDKRLLAGVARFGTDNWQLVAHFVGNGRNRAQCSQRWTRGLNPKISKKNWTPEDDKQLIELVETYGDKSWTKIANILGNRSDVQCRYHYRQITNNSDDLGSDNNENSDHNTISYSQSFNQSTPDQRLPHTEYILPSSSFTITDDTISITASRKMNFSSPGFTMPKICPFSSANFQNPTPITPQLRHRQEQLQKQALNYRSCFPISHRAQWGVCGTDQESLNIFLSQFQ